MKKRFLWLPWLLAVLLLAGCAKTVRWNGEVEILGECLMVSDVSDLQTYAGLVDNIFVGTVEEVLQNRIPRRATYESQFSSYRITVDENLKGSLQSTVECSKLGGIRSDGTMLLLAAELPDGTFLQDRGLPEPGRQYIFMTYTQPDGTLQLSELLDTRTVDAALLEAYRDAIENQIPFDRERFSSIYDLP